MEEKKLLERYAYFYNEINKLSEFSIEEDPGVNDIEMSKSSIQTAYRDIKAEKDNMLEKGIIDYLCWLSTEMFLKRWLEDCKKDSFKDEGKPNIERALVFNLGPENKEIKNVLRLLFKDPIMFFSTSSYYYKIRELDKKIEDKKIFLILMEYRFYLKENTDEVMEGGNLPFTSTLCINNKLDAG